MKIVSTPSADWTTRLTCQTCTTVVEVGVDDLTFVADSRDGDAVTWKCPTCGNTRWASVSLVPRGVRHLLRR